MTLMSNDSAVPFIDRAAAASDQVAQQAFGAAHNGIAAVRDGTHMLFDRAQRVSDGTATYIRGEPMKSILIAAAAGAVLMAVLGLVARPRRPM